MQGDRLVPWVFLACDHRSDPWSWCLLGFCTEEDPRQQLIESPGQAGQGILGSLDASWTNLAVADL